MYLLFVCKPFTYLFVSLVIEQQQFVNVAALFQFFSFVDLSFWKLGKNANDPRRKKEKSVNLLIFPDDKLGDMLVEVFIL